MGTGLFIKHFQFCQSTRTSSASLGRDVGTGFDCREMPAARVGDVSGCAAAGFYISRYESLWVKVGWFIPTWCDHSKTDYSAEPPRLAISGLQQTGSNDCPVVRNFRKDRVKHGRRHGWRDGGFECNV